MEYVAAVITAIGAIIMAWFTYNQNTKDKLTDYKLEKWKKESERKMGEQTAIYSDIYSKLHLLINKLDADRVYIIQPHPLVDSLFISVTLEVTHPYRDVTNQKKNMQNLRMSQWNWFSRKLQEEYIVYSDISMISDIRTKAEFSQQGIKSIVGVKMVDENDRWIGNLCAGFTHRRIEDIELPTIKQSLKNKAILIQFKLPEYKEEGK